MRVIRFGTYSLKIKTLDPGNFTLPDGHGTYTYAIYQKVFHFWYIPIFPIDKNWKAKDKQTGKECIPQDPAVRNALNIRTLKTKTPLWSYTGSALLALPALLLLGWIFYWAVDDSIDKTGKFISKEHRKATKENLVKAPEIDDLYIFRFRELEPVIDYNGQQAGYKKTYWGRLNTASYTVNYVSKDSIGLKLTSKDHFYQAAYLLKEDIRFSRQTLYKAIKKFDNMDLYELKYPEEAHQNVLVSGIYEITRTANPED